MPIWLRNFTFSTIKSYYSKKEEPKQDLADDSVKQAAKQMQNKSNSPDFVTKKKK